MKVPTDIDEARAVARAAASEHGRVLLRVLDARRTELQTAVQTAPRRSDDLRQDCGGMLCEIAGLRYLPDYASACDEALRRADEGT